VTTAPTTAQTLRKISTEVSERFLERRGVIDALILTILAKENAFILGPPGTGKSMLVRELITRFLGADLFEALLSKTRPDQAVLGPYDQGEFIRKTKGYLPEANFAFIDEVGKMSPTLGHDMLAVLNERVLHQVTAAGSTIDVPLYSAITASNELIVQESDDAAALWDRLLVRVTVDYIQESGAFHTLLTLDENGGSRTTLDFAALQHAIDVEVPAIKVPNAVIDVVMQLRDKLKDAEISVSDRRWRQCVKILRASAYLDGRSEVNDDDVHQLRYCLWDGPEQKLPVERMCLQVSNPLAEKLLGYAEDVETISRQVRDQRGKSAKDRAAAGVEANGKIKILLGDLTKLKTAMQAEGRSTTAVDETIARLDEVKSSIMVDLLGV
jgi:MoxR-like ATPase